ncbi:hypothetical protein FACS1894178_3750 [Bacteroidia bacterium]|nr:hypothetical protein FACS1894178_3750 [Bacteroidia bacterium]
MKNLKLNKIAEGNLNEKQMHQIKGGGATPFICSCGCQYANSGGSSISANMYANCSENKVVPANVEKKAECYHF